MTRVYGVATDPLTGVPLARRVVYALLQNEQGVTMPPLTSPVVSESMTDSTGRWDLELRQTTGTDAYYVIRVWLHDTYEVDVPVAPALNAAVHVEDIRVEPPEPETPPSWELPKYVKLTEKGVPNGVATLGPDGILLAAQRPAQSGGAIDPQDWFAGDGPPPPTIPGASVGDMYIDRLTGDLYQLD